MQKSVGRTTTTPDAWRGVIAEMRKLALRGHGWIVMGLDEYDLFFANISSLKEEVKKLKESSHKFEGDNWIRAKQLAQKVRELDKEVQDWKAIAEKERQDKAALYERLRKP